MAEEVPKHGDKFRKKEIKLSHPIVSRVLSKISEIEKKEEEETSQLKTSLEVEPETPKKAKRFIRKKINFMAKIFSISVILFFGGWCLVTRSVPFKTRLVDRFSTLTRKIIKEKDAIWIRRKIPGALKGKESSFLEGKIRKDVKGIPVYIGARKINILNEDNVSTLNFTTSDPMDRVVTFYIKEMGKRGYGLVKADYFPGAEIGQLLFSLEGRECTISLVENERGGVNVAISYIE